MARAGATAGLGPTQTAESLAAVKDSPACPALLARVGVVSIEPPAGGTAWVPPQWSPREAVDAAADAHSLRGSSHAGGRLRPRGARGRTAGGSSGGSGAAVAGGLVPLCTAADGGGSIRIPAAFNGLFGLKGTYGRVPRGPHAYSRPSTEVFGCLARSVRDTARYYDVCAGADPQDPWSLPSNGGWEAALGTHELRGRKMGLVPDLGGVVLADGVEAHVRASAEALADATGMEMVDLQIDTPNLASEWMMSNVSTLMAELGDRWPRCGKDLTHAIDDGLRLSQTLYNLRTAAAFERKRLRLNDAMAAAFEQVDFVVAATNDGPPFAADAEMSNPPSVILDQVMKHPVSRALVAALLALARAVGGVFPGFPSLLLEQVASRVPELVNMGALTIVSNLYGNPAASIPSGLLDGMPLGMQVLARHHDDALLLDLGLAAEREIGWPMIAPQAC